MSFSLLRALRVVSAYLLTTITIASLVVAQEPQQPADQTEVIRINTELVQTGVVVVDKQGRFVPGLKSEQFQLRVDGKPVTPTFFEQVTAGTAREEKLESAVAKGAMPEKPIAPASDASYRGRTVVFFIDDLHLSAPSVVRTRAAILEFIDKQMGPEDRVAIASASGQIGFLQQFTEVKPVLRAAVGRLTHKPYTVRDAENITMTEYLALKIDQGDKGASDYFVDELLKATNFKIASVGGLGPQSGGPANTRPQGGGMTGGMTREAATRVVKERALVMLRQSSSITGNTLATLESLMRSSNQMAGRKIVFFISDGFFLDNRNSTTTDKLKQITDAALRAGVVIYSMDARGLVSLTTDAASNRTESLSHSNVGELSASQDALATLADDTGGRALFNSDKLTNAVNDALRETSNYYLLAWRPTAEEQKGANYKRLEVSIVGRPELSARLPKGFLLGDPPTAAKSEVKTPSPETNSTAPTKAPQAALVSALSAPTARRGLPMKLSVSFMDVPNSGPVLTAATQMATDVLGYGKDGKEPAAIDLAGVILNDQGKQAGSFQTRVNVNPLQNTAVQNPGVIYTRKVSLTPGIYQVRVAARDDKSGRVGSAAQWVEIPDLSSKRLTLSSLMVGGQFIGAGSKSKDGEEMQFSVDRRFARGAHLNFLTFIYNAARGSSGPELEAQIKLSRNGQAIVTSPQRKVGIESTTDPARVVYGADIALQTLPVGRYLLEVMVTDKVAKTSATQQITFEIE